MKPEIVEIADSLNTSQRKKFLELTEKINLHDPSTYNHLNLKEYVPLLRKIDDLYDGKVDYIKEFLKRMSSKKSWKAQTEKLMTEIIKQ